MSLTLLLRGRGVTGHDIVGSLVLQANKNVAGAVTPTGTLSSTASAKVLAGSSTPAGTLVKEVRKNLAGGLTPSGSLDAVLVTPSLDEVYLEGHFPYFRSVGTEWNDQWEERQHATIAPDTTKLGSVPRGIPAKFTANQASAYMQGQISDPERVRVTPGSQVTLAADFWADTTGRNCNFTIGQYDVDGVFLSDQQGTGASDVVGVWTRVSDTFTVDAACYSIRPIIRIGPPGDNCANGEIHWVDALSVRPGTSTVYVDEGALLIAVEKVLAGSLTPTGTLAKTAVKVLGGTSTPSGQLVREAEKVLAGTSAPTGQLVKAVQKNLAGALTPTGTLDADFVPGSTVTEQDVAGTLTPTGLLVKETEKNLGGAVVPTGTLTTRTATSLGGALTPTGGLVRETRKNLAGAVTPTGTLVAAARYARTLAGELVPSGSLTKLAGKVLAGTVTPSGTLTAGAIYTKALAGTVSSAGSLVRSVAKVLGGGVTPSGQLSKLTGKYLDGNVTPTGNVMTQSGNQVSLGGTTIPSGSVSFLVFKNGLGGNTTPSGQLAKVVTRALAGTSTPTGSLVKLVGKELDGVLVPSGTLVPGVLYQLALGGAVTPAGTLATRLGLTLVGVIGPTGQLTLVFVPGSATGTPGTVEGEVSSASLIAVSVSSAVDGEVAGVEYPVDGRVFGTVEGDLDVGSIFVTVSA